MSLFYIKGGDSIKTILRPGVSMATIQTALDGQGEVLFVGGLFHITRPLYINSNIHIRCKDGGRLRQAAKIHNILMTRCYKNTTRYNGASKIVIEGLEIEGMAKYSTPLNLLTLWHAHDVKIRDCKFLDVVHFHALEINGSKNIIVEDTSFNGYKSNPKADYREQIQIDFSSESAIFVFEKRSKCYDNTPCENITIRNCTFDKSNSRPAASACIGNHCQGLGAHHKNIIIEDCNFKGYGTNPGDACIKLSGMDDVTIRNNMAEGFGRFVFASKKIYSYDKNGVRKTPNKDDGLCRRLDYQNNTVTKPTGKYKAWQLYDATARK